MRTLRTYIFDYSVRILVGLFIGTGIILANKYPERTASTAMVGTEPSYLKTDLTLTTLKSLENCNMYSAQSVQRYLCTKRVLEAYAAPQVKPCADGAVKAVVPPIKIK